MSRDGARMIRGRPSTLQYFTTRLDDLNDGISDDHLAVCGLLPSREDPDDTDGDPCALFYDGFHKACVLQLGLDTGHLVDRILVSAENSILCRAWPIEPPPFRQAAIMPQLTVSATRQEQ